MIAAASMTLLAKSRPGGKGGALLVAGNVASLAANVRPVNVVGLDVITPTAAPPRSWPADPRSLAVIPLLDRATRRIGHPHHAQSVTPLADRGHPAFVVTFRSAALTRIFLRFRIPPRILLTRQVSPC
jgi:hypothetical protein